MDRKPFKKDKSRAAVDLNAAIVPWNSWLAAHGISRATGYRVVRRGELRLTKIGRLSYVRREDSEKFFASLPYLTAAS